MKSEKEILQEVIDIIIVCEKRLVELEKSIAIATIANKKLMQNTYSLNREFLNKYKLLYKKLTK